MWWYGYWMRKNRSINKRDDHIGVSSHPHKRLQQHNRESGFEPGPKSTYSPTDKWRLYMIIGPYIEEQHALSAAEEWKAARTTEKKHAYAREEARECNLTLYLSDEARENEKPLNF